MTKYVKLTRSLEPSKEYGMITKLVYPDRSRVYIHKKGWTLASPKVSGPKLKKLLARVKKYGYAELLIPYNEIDVAIKETIRAGYVVKKI